MHFLIGLFFFHLGCNYLFTWETRTPEFYPKWIGTRPVSQISYLKKELKKHPSNTQILSRIAYLYTRRGQLRNAKRYLQLASNKGATGSFFYLSKGLFHGALQENLIAEKLLFKALLMNEQEDPEYFFHFAQYLYRIGNTSQSIHWLQLGLKLHPSHPHLLILLALNYISNSNWIGAETNLIKARQLFPDFDQYISFNLAKLYSMVQAWDPAIYNLRRATLKGYRDYPRIELDRAFDPIRNHPQFILLLNQAQRNNETFLNLYRFKKI